MLILNRMKCIQIKKCSRDATSACLNLKITIVLCYNTILEALIPNIDVLLVSHFVSLTKRQPSTLDRLIILQDTDQHIIIVEISVPHYILAECAASGE